MEETKRRRFIIRAVLEGEVDVQEQPQPEPSQEEVFGTFTKGKTMGKMFNPTESTPPLYGTYVQNSSNSRACIFAPIENRNYTLTVTDSLYSVAVYGLVDDTPIPTSYNLAVMHEYFQGDTETVSWGSSASSTAPYILVALRKNSGNFTAEELAEGATAVFTFTRG